MPFIRSIGRWTMTLWSSTASLAVTFLASPTELRANPIAMIVAALAMALIMRIIYFLIALAIIILLIWIAHHAEKKSRSLVTSSPGTA